MLVVHLLASPFMGGPEHQVLGLAQHLPPPYETAFLSFAEGGKAGAFLEAATAAGFEAIELEYNWPRVRRATAEVADRLHQMGAAILCTSGYKPDIIGHLAARRIGIPAVAIAHGWTGATWKVRLNEMADRLVMRRFDRVISVSEAQADKVRAAGVRPSQMVTIRNAVAVDELTQSTPRQRERLGGLFPSPPTTFVVAAGRFSREKRFDLFIIAAAEVARRHPNVGFVLFGDGPLRQELSRQIAENGLQERFVLPGFRPDLRELLPAADLLVLSSRSEGLPVIVLEVLAVGVPVVSTAVGGVPEVIQNGVHGYLVLPGTASALAERIDRLLLAPDLREEMAVAGQRRILQEFTCERQSQRYQAVFEQLAGAPPNTRT